jgi:hypothetical protein
MGYMGSRADPRPCEDLGADTTLVAKGALMAHGVRTRRRIVRSPADANLDAGRSLIVTITLGFLLAIIALICGVLMLLSGRWSRLPLAAIAIICLALNESGLLSSLAR